MTLVEVVVAAVVLQIGLMAALSTLVVASRVLREAEEAERAVNVAAWLVDSLASGADTLGGTVSHPGLTARWPAGPGPDIVIETLSTRLVIPGADSVRLR
ncbi:MAG: hypothetical protein AAF389_18280 [Gemmatimonadota bacterium]